MPLDLKNDYLTIKRFGGLRQSTLDHYEYVLDQLIDWRTSDRQLETLTRSEAQEYVSYLLDEYKPAGVESRLKALKAFYNWLIEEEETDANPFRKMSIDVPDVPQPTPTEAEIKAMIDKAGGLGSTKKMTKKQLRAVTIVTTLADTGCRRGELAGVTADDVDLDSGMLTFRHSKTKPRTVPLTDRNFLALKTWHQLYGTEGPYYWDVKDAAGVIRRSVENNSDFSPHSLRRAFAVRWLSSGATEIGLMRICGWNSREMIQRYVRASADDLAQDEFRRMMDRSF